MRKEVQDAYVDIKHNPDIWVAIITAAGDVFCSGKDIVEKMPENDGQVMSNDELYLYLRYLYKPIICAINGPCLAQGAGFALNSDILIFSERGVHGLAAGAPGNLLGERPRHVRACDSLDKGDELT